MTKYAIFRLYSMTRPSPSVAIMMLVEDGRILLSDTVSRHIPKLKDLQVSVPRLDPQTGKVAYTLVPAEREMTIQDLLRHTSGLVYGQNTSHLGVKEAYAKEGVDWNGVTASEQVERLARVPLARHPGSGWEYSISTDVLGRVVEAVSGVRLRQVFQEPVFAPLQIGDNGLPGPDRKT